MIKRIRYLIFVRLLIGQNRGIPRPESAISFLVVIFQLPMATIGAVTRAESGRPVKIPLGWRHNALSPLELFEGMPFPIAFQVAQLLAMGLTPALEDRMCRDLNGLMAKSQPLAVGEAAKEGTEELV
jgi:hypothetical protein